MKGSELEHLIEIWLMHGGWTTHRAAPAGLRGVKRAGKPSFTVKSNDIFGCLDILAIRRDPNMVWGIQCTTVAGRSARRGKVAKLKDRWPSSWRVSVVTMQKPGVLKSEDLDPIDGVWRPPALIAVDVAAVKAWWKKLGDSVLDRMVKK